MSKKILIVSRAFHPIIAPRSFRATELAKEFAKQGNEVTVLTHKRSFDYTDFERKHNIVIKDFTQNKWKEIKGRSFFSKALRKTLRYLFLFPEIQLSFMLKSALTSKNDFDLLISIANPYPVHWGVAIAKRSNPTLSKVWVADCGDPFMGNKEESFKRPFYFKYIENWFCRNAELITVPIKEAITAYPAFCRKKIIVIPQGFNFEEIVFAKRGRTYSNLAFGYAGALSKGVRDPSEFLEYLCTKQDLDFKFIIYTNNRAAVEPFRTRLKSKLEIRDYVPREQLLNDLRGMDFLVNFENRDTVQSPSKLIDYALIGRPIISINPFQINKKIVDEFLAKNYTNQYIIQNVDQYNIKTVANQFLELAK